VVRYAHREERDGVPALQLLFHLVQYEVQELIIALENASDCVLV
jgi:hypothetical protein